MGLLRDVLKGVIPAPIRRRRRILSNLSSDAKTQWKRLNGPPPMNDFSDYDDYWEKRGKLRTVFRRWQVAADCIEDGATLLDVGCGTGEFLSYLRARKPTVKSKGIDFSPTSIAMTRSAGFQVEAADIAQKEIRAEYDYITCFEVLEHIADAESAIRHLRKAFRKQLIVSIPNVGYVGCRIRLAVFGRFPVTMC